MQVNAIYHHTVEDDGREVHAIDHDGGGFVVSSKEVGVAIQNFLHYAKLEDIATLHNHLLREYARRTMAEAFYTPSYANQKDINVIHKRGFADGENAVGWMIDPATQDDPFMFISRLLTGLEDGDPEILDSLPQPRVAGEFADDPTWEQVCMEETGHYYDDGEDDLFAVYNEAFHEGVEAQIRKLYNDLSPSKKV